MFGLLLLPLFAWALLASQSSLFISAYTPTPPPISPATSLPNSLYTWRSQQIRYCAAGPPDAPQCAVLVHGLFVNADHWRFTMKGLADAGYRVYALDLLGCGWSSKPPRESEEARRLNGELGRFHDSGDNNSADSSNSVERGLIEEYDEAVAEEYARRQQQLRELRERVKGPSILPNVELGTASGSKRVANVDLRHPLNSPYNFYTWSEQIADFTRDVVLGGAAADDNGDTIEEGQKPDKNVKQATLIANSIGTISSLQSILDHPDLYNGVCVVNPNFRELHSAEVPLPSLFMPVLRSVQRLLREKGQGLFESLAKRDIVEQILKEPYANQDAIDEELLTVLLDPLLTEGASDVVFDTLSYSAGPLPEQQLSQLSQLSSPTYPSKTAPVWVLYGKEDPWTPPARVESLITYQSVEKVVVLEGCGHCPHDERPEVVNPILVEFMERVAKTKGDGAATAAVEAEGAKTMDGATVA